MNNINISNNTFIGEGNSVVHISKAARNITVSGNISSTALPPTTAAVACSALHPVIVATHTNAGSPSQQEEEEEVVH
jgi:hypothetical protein